MNLLKTMLKILGVTALAIAAMMVFALVKGQAPETATAATSRQLDVRVGWDGTSVRVTNNGPDGVGRELTIYLNGQPPLTFRADTTVPRQGQSITVPLREFVKKDGERFNPLTHGVTEAWVGGGGYDYRSFTNR